MKILIVEDERKAREGLFNLLTRIFPEMTILEPALNGRSGLRMIENDSPDIVLTDIRMPDLDGLEMISLIPRNMNWPYIVVITGYSEFEYARKSIQLGVKDFLLKPFTPALIKQVIQKAVEYRKTSTFLYELLERNSSAGLPKGFQFLFRYDRESDDTDIYQFIRKFMVRLSGEKCKLDEYCDTARHLISFIIRSDKGDRLQNSTILELKRSLSRKFGTHIAGVWKSMEHEGDKSDILFRCLELHKFYEQEVLMNSDDLYPQILPLNNYPWQQEKQLLRTLREGDLHSARTHFQDWYSFLTEVYHMPEVIEEQIEKLLYSLMNVLKEVNAEGFREGLALNYTAQLQDCFHADDIKCLINALIDCFGKTSAVLESDNVIIMKVLQYMNTHMMEPITLEETAEWMQISPEHLSRQFKEEIGSGFNSYVNKRKIELAREMLQKNQFAVHEVAERLGYSSPRYFTRVFKKFTKMTPREFRELRSANY